MSDRKLASIQIISDLQPIVGADAIFAAKVLGWTLVVKKTEFSIGDKCVFFEIDSILPIADWNAHLRKGSEAHKPLRVRTIKLRGTISQGVALPTTLLPEGTYEVGQDVTEVIGVQKWEPYIPAELNGKVKGTRPSWIPKTDETRLQSEPELLLELRTLNCGLIGTMKMDGSSITCYLRQGEFGVCSRNMELIETPGNAFWKAVRENYVEERMRSAFPNGDYAIQGELCGPGLNGNRVGLGGLAIYFFNLYDIQNVVYCSRDQLEKFIKNSGLNIVPRVYTIGVEAGVTVAEFVKLATDLNYPNGNPAEGIVWRPSEEKYSNILKGRLSFKTISERFLLAYKDA
jgi:RNA ligase (TIGR02306 family)